MRASLLTGPEKSSVVFGNNINDAQPETKVKEINHRDNSVHPKRYITRKECLHYENFNPFGGRGIVVKLVGDATGRCRELVCSKRKKGH